MESDLFLKTGAHFSPCRTWRYALWRLWEPDRGIAMFIGLNPSTADEHKDDPTIRRCIGFARDWGFGGIYMTNLFAFRATDPKVMIAADDPVGPYNDEAIRFRQFKARVIVAAWGSVSTRYRPRLQWQSRIAKVASLCTEPLRCLGHTQDGSPRHPLYVPKSAELVQWKAVEAS